MKKNISTSLLLFCFSVKIMACTVFTASNNTSVLVGNNEDNDPNLNSFLWFYPKSGNNNGYITWGYNKKFPEGGMNEKGLFWDAAALPVKIPIIVDKNKKNFYTYFVEKALRECATVAEVIKLISQYNLFSQEKAQILIADDSGDYALIHANYIIKKSDIKRNYFALSNYCLNDNKSADFQCHRQGYAQNILTNSTDISIDLFKNILEKTIQTDITNATLYSQICDLKNVKFHLYNFNDFDQSKIIDIKEELQKGAREVEIKTYFSKPISNELEVFFNKNEFQKAVEHNIELIKSKKESFNFSVRYLDDLGYKYLNNNELKTAMEVFKLNLKNNPNSDIAYASMAAAYLIAGNKAKAIKYFKKSKKINPENYLANLQLNQKKGNVIFNFKHFEGVEKLSLVGSFNKFEIGKNQFTKNEDGNWVCTITLQPGKYQYKFVVGDGNWYNDPLNKLAIKPEKYWDSLLIVN